MTSGFLPEGYEVPKSGGNYMKLKQGPNKFRILSAPIIGWEYWSEDRKPVRARASASALLPFAISSISQLGRRIEQRVPRSGTLVQAVVRTCLPASPSAPGPAIYGEDCWAARKLGGQLFGMSRAMANIAILRNRSRRFRSPASRPRSPWLIKTL
jgi:hypothetical protein